MGEHDRFTYVARRLEQCDMRSFIFFRFISETFCLSLHDRRHVSNFGNEKSIVVMCVFLLIWKISNLYIHWKPTFLIQTYQHHRQTPFSQIPHHRDHSRIDARLIQDAGHIFFCPFKKRYLAYWAAITGHLLQLIIDTVSRYFIAPFLQAQQTRELSAGMPRIGHAGIVFFFFASL